MEISTEIQKNTRRHIVKGAISIDELKNFLRETIFSSETNKKRNVLWDLREADFPDVSSKDLMSFIGFARANWGSDDKCKFAIVVSEEIGYELARFYEVMLEQNVPSSIEVFRDIKGAEKWLGLT